MKCPHCQHEIVLDHSGLPPRLASVRDFIVGYIAEHHMSPTFDEIAADQKISKPAVHEYVHVLADRGFIKIERHKKRSIQVSSKDGLVSTSTGAMPQGSSK